MEMIQICTAKGEVNAAVIKGFLENIGIQAGFGPQGFVLTNGVGMGSNQLQNIFVPKDKAEEALKILIEKGLIVA